MASSLNTTEYSHEHLSFSRIPQWDGTPSSFRTFERAVKWWLSGEDLAKTLSFNLAARFVQRQTGTARARAMEFEPEELAGIPAATQWDDTRQEYIVIAPAQPTAGIDKVMAAFRSMVGDEVVERKTTLRDEFHKELARRHNERVIDFASRFRDKVSEMKREGIALDDEELGYQLSQKLGLNQSQRQLLEVAMTGRERTYANIEQQVTKLFKDLHGMPNREAPRQAQPFSRPGSGFRQGFGKWRTPSNSSAASTTAPSTSSASGRPRLAMEAVQEGAGQDEDYDAAGAEGAYEYEDDGQVLEGAMEREMQAFAAELDTWESTGPEEHSLAAEAEAEGERFVEAYVAMQEARQRLAAVRKDRKYGAPPAPGDGAKGKGKGKGRRFATPADRKRVSSCWDLLGLRRARALDW